MGIAHRLRKCNVIVIYDDGTHCKITGDLFMSVKDNYAVLFPEEEDGLQKEREEEEVEND